MITFEQYQQAKELIEAYNKQQSEGFINSVELDMYKGYFADKLGNIYNSKGKCINKIKYAKTGRPQSVVSINGNKMGAATIIATQFIDNPKDYAKIIFIDDNPLNLSITNIVWVSNEISYLRTKIKYPDICPMGKGGKKAETVDRDTAILKAKDIDLKRYYMSGNEKILNELWSKIDSEVRFKDWDKVKTEIYIYFIDRCKRRSLFGNPYAYIISLAQIKIKAYKKTINTATAKQSRQLDEELIKVW